MTTVTDIENHMLIDEFSHHRVRDSSDDSLAKSITSRKSNFFKNIELYTIDNDGRFVRESPVIEKK